MWIKSHTSITVGFMGVPFSLLLQMNSEQKWTAIQENTKTYYIEISEDIDRLNIPSCLIRLRRPRSKLRVMGLKLVSISFVLVSDARLLDPQICEPTVNPIFTEMF